MRRLLACHEHMRTNGSKLYSLVWMHLEVAWARCSWKESVTLALERTGPMRWVYSERSPWSCSGALDGVGRSSFIFHLLGVRSCLRLLVHFRAKHTALVRC